MMSAQMHDLPVLIAGRRKDPGPDAISLDYSEGLTVRLHRPTMADARTMLASDPRPLREMSFDDITIFFAKVRDRWMDPANHWRRIAIELGSRVTGYAERIIESDVEYLGRTLDRPKQYDFVETDLGDAQLLDEWRPSRAVYNRCWPKGIIAHVMVGNVPLASLFALYRSLATKNITIAKVPSRDVVAALAFANCIYDTDPGHPVTRALSCLYWEAASEVEHAVIGGSDVLSVWGRGETVEALKKRVPPGSEFIEFVSSAVSALSCRARARRSSLERAWPSTRSCTTRRRASRCRRSTLPNARTNWLTPSHAHSAGTKKRFRVGGCL